MLVSSIAHFNALKNNNNSVQMQSAPNSFNGVQKQSNNTFSLANLKSAIHKLNILA